MGRRKITKYETTGEQKPIVSIYELIGGAAHPYETLDEKEYEKKLNDMNLVDLQEHAIQLNIVPVDDRERLTDKLVREFMTTVSSYKASQAKDNGNKVEGDSKKALDILSRGR